MDEFADSDQHLPILFKMNENPMPTHTAVNTVALFPHIERQQAIEAAAILLAEMESKGLRVILDSGVANLLEHPQLAVGAEELATKADVAVAIGGDGTLLYAFHAAPNSLLVGVNCGDLGYLAEVSLDDLHLLVERLVSGDFETKELLTLAVTTQVGTAGPGTESTTAIALNDVVIGKGSEGRVPKFVVRVDDRPFVSMLADAIVFATPTGSTAYNFSARGPILSPTIDGFLLTPVAPHTLWDRSLVLGPSTEVEIRLRGDRSAALFVDGLHSGEIDGDCTLRVAVAEQSARMIVWSDEGFPERLKQILRLDQPQD